MLCLGSTKHRFLQEWVFRLRRMTSEGDQAAKSPPPATQRALDEGPTSAARWPRPLPTEDTASCHPGDSVPRVALAASQVCSGFQLMPRS